MKESRYNYYIKNDSIVLMYNSLNDAYLILKKEAFDFFNENLNNLMQLEELNNKLYITLLNNGFIVQADCDEKNIYQNLLFNRKFSSNFFELIINPTLDCNLNCWYCYEEHIRGSIMTPDVIENVVLFVKKQYELLHFKHFSLTFFGGEPLLYEKKVVIPLIQKIKNIISNEVEFQINITTNGTKVSKQLLSELSLYKTNFQITFDGDKKVHNSVRLFKNSNKGTYDLILNNLKLICDNLTHYFLNIRINFNAQTLNNAKLILDDLSFIDKSKFVISLHKVWQENDDKIDYNEVFEFINYAHKKEIIVDYMALGLKTSVCYADNYSQLLVNYDGGVYKCTARDFNKENSIGRLLDNGIVEWNIEKLAKIINFNIPKICEECKLLPSCPGLCSQKAIEQGDNIKCNLSDGFSIDDYIIYNFNRYALLNKNK